VKEYRPYAAITNPVQRLSGFSQLQILNLSNNSLNYLPSTIFHACANLQTLDLSNNLIKNLETEIFHPLINLLRLDVRCNRLKSLNEAIFRNLSKLLTLDVSYNDIAHVAPTTFQYLTSLNTLILAANPLSSSLVLLSASRHLQIVDVSATGLKVVPTAVERTVRTLQLKGNLLSAIQSGDLDSYSLLSYLNLDNNHISYVEEDAMGRLELLDELHISKNKLFHVPRSLPEKLQLLDLSFNLIQNVSNQDFLNLSSLKELSLSNNHIHSIEEESFSGLLCLKTLDLSHNPLLVLPPLTGPLQLQVLNLSYLSNVSRIWRLGIRTFPVPNPGSVVNLNLEASPALSAMFMTDTSTLQRFVNMSTLCLRYSNLTIVRRDLYTLLPMLKEMDLEGNPWHCDREMLVTSEWLVRHNGARGIRDADTMHCATPPRLHGKPLEKLSLQDFSQNPGKMEKLNTLEIFRTQSSFKGAHESPSAGRIYLKSYENSIDNGDREIEKTSEALGVYQEKSKLPGSPDKSRQVNNASAHFNPSTLLNSTTTTPTITKTDPVKPALSVAPPLTNNSLEQGFIQTTPRVIDQVISDDVNSLFVLGTDSQENEAFETG